MNNKRIKFVLELTDFINKNLKLFEGIYELQKTGKANLTIDNKEVLMEMSNFNELKKDLEPLYSTVLLMLLSMKQLEVGNIDKMLTIDNEEIEELHYYVEYLKTLPNIKYMEEKYK